MDMTTSHRRRLPPSCSTEPRLLLATLLATLAWQAEAQASDPAAETVIVTASRADTRLQDMPLHTTVITQSQIRDATAQTLDQLLRNVPSLLVPGSPAYTTDPTGHNIKLRGMDKKVLVLLDGIPVLDPFYATIQWFKLPLAAIERVEIVRGGGSSLWGNLAVGGVINIVSKRMQGDQTDGELRAGGLGTASAALSRHWRLSESLGLNLSADGFRSDGYDNSPQNLRATFWPGRGSSSATARNLRLGLAFRPSVGLEGFARIGYHEQNEDIGGYAFGTNLQKSPDLHAGFTRSFGEGSRLDGSVYAQQVDFDKWNGAACHAAATYACGAPVPGTGATAAQQAAAVLQYASSHDINTYRERGGSVVYAGRLGGVVGDVVGDWQLGLDYRRISGEDEQTSYRTPTAAFPAPLRIQRSNHGGGAQSFAGVFTQVELHPIEALAVTFSARVDRFSNTDGIALQTNYSNVVAPVVLSSLGGPVPGLSRTAFDPSLSARYAVTDALALRASAYRGFRAPGLNNLYRSFSSSAISIANPLLAPETLVGEEFGADWKGRGWTLGATIFQANVRNVVATYAITAATPIPAAVQNICGASYAGVANAACPGTVSFYGNGQDQHSSGLEFDARWALSGTIDLSAYVTQTRTHYTRTTTGDPIGVQLPLVPEVVAGANLSWQAGTGWTLNAELRYGSAMTLSSLTLSPALRQGGTTVANLGASYRIGPSIELTGSVTNLGDKRFTDSSASNLQGVSYALPRVVSVGMRGRF
jgi:iron complex outermembrane receptor protein